MSTSLMVSPSGSVEVEVKRTGSLTSGTAGVTGLVPTIVKLADGADDANRNAVCNDRLSTSAVGHA